MTEVWKSVVCNSPICLAQIMAPQNFKPGGGIRKEILESYRVYPDVDNETGVHFTCPRCGQEESWGPDRVQIARVLHERFTNVS